jgi:hypothetical protein
MRFKPLHLLLVLGIVSVTVYAVASSYFDSGIAFDEGELYIRSNGRGGTDTAITPSAAEFNILDGMTVTSTQINNVVTSATNWVGATSTNAAVTSCTGAPLLSGLVTASNINNAVARYAGEWDEGSPDYAPHNMLIAVGSVTFTTSTTIEYYFPTTLTSFQAIIATADMTSSNTTFLTFVESTPGVAGTLSAWEPSAADATTAPKPCDDTITVYWTAFGY